jgi:cytochrome c oxidase cbb3-type subunit 3
MKTHLPETTGRFKRGPFAIILAAAVCLDTVFLASDTSGHAQSVEPEVAQRAAAQENIGPDANAGEATPSQRYGKLLQVPVSKLIPGNVPVQPSLGNPLDKNKDAAIQDGMRYFTSFNCVGCHMDNGGGGMGPALSNNAFIYGAKPENIYLSIVQGRPNGMPAWGSVLPDNVIWALVAYIGSISDAPSDQWGTTISRTSPAIEQVPAEFQKTARPWDYTQKFSNGQKP